MALGIEVLVERVFAGTGRVVRDDGHGALGSDGLTEAIAVIGGIRHDDFCRQALDQGVGLWGVALLTSRESKPHRAAEATHGEMDLGAQAAAGAAKGLIFRPPFFAPAACWWARMIVESTIRYSKSGSSEIAAKMRHQTPLWLPRLKRLKTLFHSPNASGRSRQGDPVRTIHSTPSTNIRLFRPVEPFWSGRPMISGAIRSHAASLKAKRSITPKTAPQKAALNLICS